MLYLSACGEISSKVIFQPFVNEAARWTNKYYGGLNIPAKRVVYIHGSVDPWHVLGMTNTEESDNRGTSHSSIMYPLSKEAKQSTPSIDIGKARSPKLLGVLAGGFCPRSVESPQAQL